MRVQISAHSDHPVRNHSFLRWSRNLLFATGIFALGYCAYVTADAFIFQAHQARELDQAMSLPKAAVSISEAANAPVPADVLSTENTRSNPMGMGKTGGPGVVLGRIEIKKIGLAVMILEGVDNRSLRRAVGHVPNTAMPGEFGNVAIAGHRDTYFRGLRNVAKNDEIAITTLSGSFRYVVDFSEIVDPSATEVLDPSTDATLTLVTCYPFSYIGSAPKRLIVRAHLISD